MQTCLTCLKQRVGLVARNGCWFFLPMNGFILTTQQKSLLTWIAEVWLTTCLLPSDSEAARKIRWLLGNGWVMEPTASPLGPWWHDNKGYTQVNKSGCFSSFDENIHLVQSQCVCACFLLSIIYVCVGKMSLCNWVLRGELNIYSTVKRTKQGKGSIVA